MVKHNITAKIVADSNSRGHRITTFLLTYPRCIHAEVMTHRVFSRNTASSRAIPFEKMVNILEENPFIPIAFQKAHKGMQGNIYLEGEEAEEAMDRWIDGKNSALQCAKDLANTSVTKQLCNRKIEPYLYHTALVTSTEWDNFLDLRCPKYQIYAGPEDTKEVLCEGRSWKDLMESNNGLAKDFDTQDTLERLKHSISGAEIHIQVLAEAIWDKLKESTPVALNPGDWHIPFHKDMPFGVSREDQIKIAVARCARLSYMNFDGAINHEKDLELHDILLSSKHMSPFEHCAKAMKPIEYYNNARLEMGVYHYGWSNNIRGFIQYRFLVEKR